MLFTSFIQIHAISYVAAARKKERKPAQHLFLYKLLDLTQESFSALLSHTAVLFPRPAWKHSLVSRVVLQSHLFLTVKPAHYVALPIPAVTIQHAILHLLIDTPWCEQYKYHGWSGVNHLGPVWWEGNWNYTIALQVIHSISSLIFTGIHSHLNDMFIWMPFAVKESYCGHGLNAFSHYILQAAVKCQTRVELGLNSLSIKSPSCVTKTESLKSLQATSLIY